MMDMKIKELGALILEMSVRDVIGIVGGVILFCLGIIGFFVIVGVFLALGIWAYRNWKPNDQ